MDPVAAAKATVPLIERSGVIAAVIVCACVCVCGLVVAVAVLWRAWAAERKKLQEEQAAHYKWAVEQVVLQSDRERKMAELLSQIDLGIKGVEVIVRGAIGAQR